MKKNNGWKKNQEAFFDFYVIPFICFYYYLLLYMFAHRKNNTDKKREHLYYNWIPFWSWVSPDVNNPPVFYLVVRSSSIVTPLLNSLFIID